MGMDFQRSNKGPLDLGWVGCGEDTIRRLRLDPKSLAPVHSERSVSTHASLEVLTQLGREEGSIVGKMAGRSVFRQRLDGDWLWWLELDDCVVHLTIGKVTPVHLVLEKRNEAEPKP